MSTAIALAISPAAAPPMPSATMNSEPLRADRVRAHLGLQRRVVRRQVGDDERVLVVLARAADVGAPEHLDDDLAGSARSEGSSSRTRNWKRARAAVSRRGREAFSRPSWPSSSASAITGDRSSMRTHALASSSDSFAEHVASAARSDLAAASSPRIDASSFVESTARAVSSQRSRVTSSESNVIASVAAAQLAPATVVVGGALVRSTSARIRRLAVPAGGRGALLRRSSAGRRRRPRLRRCSRSELHDRDRRHGRDHDRRHSRRARDDQPVAAAQRRRARPAVAGAAVAARPPASTAGWPSATHRASRWPRRRHARRRHPITSASRSLPRRSPASASIARYKSRPNSAAALIPLRRVALERLVHHRLHVGGPRRRPAASRRASSAGR